MTRELVESSNIKSVGYDPAALLLEVEFHAKDGEPPRVYQCEGVEPYVFERMMTPGVSVGKIYHAEVKANPRITVTRVEVPA